MLKSTLLLGFISLAINQVYTSNIQTSKKESDYYQLNTEDFTRGLTEPKNIVISVSLGGASHTKWVLEVGQVLVNRGHRVTYVTRSDQLHLVNSFPNISGVTVGEPVYKGISIGDITRTMSFYESVRFVRQSLNNAYEPEIQYYQHGMDYTPDFMICDAFNDPCIDFSVDRKIPFAITCTGILSQEVSVPYMNSLGTTEHATSEHMTMWERFHHKYIDKLAIFYTMYPEVRRIDRIRQQFNIPPLGINRYKQFANAIKLVNTYFGFMPSQILGPLTHAVGPILSSKQKRLTEEEETYLNSHQRVVYAAFGQIVLLDKNAVEAILSSLLDQLQRGHIDGVIWVGLERQVALYEQEQDIVWQIQTTTHQYQIKAPLMQHDLLRPFYTPDWASQFSILAHPSTVLFISQGGAESANEASFIGVPFLLFPYYGDTHLTGRLLQLAGVALVHERDNCSFESVNHDMTELLLDINGTFANHVKRLKTLARIGAKRKSIAADLIEEHMYTSKDGISEHRYEPSRNMSKLKAMNLDLHATVFFFAALSLYAFYSIIRLL